MVTGWKRALRGAALGLAPAALLVGAAALQSCEKASAQDGPETTSELEVLTVRLTQAECEALPEVRGTVLGKKLEVRGLELDRVLALHALDCNSNAVERFCSIPYTGELRALDQALVFNDGDAPNISCRIDGNYRVFTVIQRPE